jgi:hypothetical protein
MTQVLLDMSPQGGSIFAEKIIKYNPSGLFTCLYGGKQYAGEWDGTIVPDAKLAIHATPLDFAVPDASIDFLTYSGLVPVAHFEEFGREMARVLKPLHPCVITHPFGQHAELKRFGFFPTPLYFQRVQKMLLEIPFGLFGVPDHWQAKAVLPVGGGQMIVLPGTPEIVCRLACLRVRELGGKVPRAIEPRVITPPSVRVWVKAPVL